MIGTQVDYANHAGVSKQAVSKWVKAGKIPLRLDGKVDFAAADHARSVSADPSRNMDIQNPISLTGDRAETVGPENSGLSYTQVRTAREAYQAKMAKLEYERLSGLYLEKRAVKDALVTVGRNIRMEIDGLIILADELDAAARNGGVAAVRSLLREHIHKIENKIAEKLTNLGDEE